jgi:single-stranded-DNA-specific exonuclease
MLNACIRTGSDEERNNLFRAFIEKDLGQTFKYKPRKSAKNPDPVEIDEDFYIHVVRICSNLKSSKQDKVCERECAIAIGDLSRKKDTKLIALNRSDMDLGLIGVLANKIANTINKPTLILRRDREENGVPFYKGSARNFKNSYVLNFKNDLLESGLVEYAAGHANAFGVEIRGENVSKLVKWFDEKYANVDVTKTFYVDYIMDGGIPFFMIREINEMKSLFSNFVEAPFIACQNIQVRTVDAQILESQNGNKRFRFVVDDVEYIKFKVSDDDDIVKIMRDSFGEEVLNINLVGKVSVSMYGGKATPQVIIEDYDCEVL